MHITTFIFITHKDEENRSDLKLIRCENKTIKFHYRQNHLVGYEFYEFLNLRTMFDNETISSFS